jgi:hypothetical protein
MKLAGALRLVKEKGAVLLVPDLTEAIAGAKIKGTWWSHPKGKLIFNVASKLEDDPEILTAKLIDQKVTFVHARLWPALATVVTDAKWRRAKMKDLGDDAKSLLRKVERRGSYAPTKDEKPARKELEDSLLVRSKSEHTDSGSHETVLESWKSWASAVVASATALNYDDAEALLIEHGISI